MDIRPVYMSQCTKLCENLMSQNLKNKDFDIAKDLDIAKEEIEYKKNFQRPNIDHLVKRIMTERRREKKNNIIMISIVLTTFGIISIFFTQA
tara:strand:+ start:247 stop:522 length:276 start_codon:yes stop_codon:yes gene_type:complete